MEEYKDIRKKYKVTEVSFYPNGIIHKIFQSYEIEADSQEMSRTGRGMLFLETKENGIRVNRPVLSYDPKSVFVEEIKE